MEIIVNGEKLDVDDPSIIGIIDQHRINPHNCIVELNGEFVDKEDFSRPLQEGDRLELIRFIGGG